ncbi:hypothetical protein JCGZ_00647 [Jatropha curcas]|uniref:WRKY transcription factor 56 n=1 Tax=Jatropha curcas TaxID=180498 RepID=S5CKI4_JATCU|nr:WRKY DNA-binding transcription factor 70 [Jatropha curcas]AGQ04250.1 WRKY transcription factor 56 [Jatropha curcas]KDP21860.1 hypothetical protein JCGZ_00647 [Jatropha curcas]
METSGPENLPTDRKSLIDELVSGREFANQLKLALKDQSINGDAGSVPAEDLVMRIVNSFTNSLSIFSRVIDSDEVSQFPASTSFGSPLWDGCRKSEESDESTKSTSRMKERRGCYKRRKTSHSWTRDTPNLVDDGHAWRKYGQKVILKAKYPRNYFRCTHKFDQGCQATKQVQRIAEEPSSYRTTYYGHHTCNNLLRASQHLILDSPNADDSSIILSFTTKQENKNNNNNNNPFFTPFESSTSIKQESKDDTVGLPAEDHTQPTLSHYLMSTHDHHQAGDVISGVNSSSTISDTSCEFGLDMDMIVNSVGGDFDEEDILKSFGYFDS